MVDQSGFPTVEISCSWCGQVQLPITELRCAVTDRALSLCEFRCPSCGQLVLRAVQRRQEEVPRQAGAAVLTDPVPFELLEPHRGPPLTWDDLLDLHLELSATRWPQDELLI